MLPCTLPALLVSLIHKVFVRLRGTLVVVFGEAKSAAEIVQLDPGFCVCQENTTLRRSGDDGNTSFV
jgi:hypothetical protein